MQFKESELVQLTDDAKKLINEESVLDGKFVLEFIKKDGTLREMAGTFTPPKEWKPAGPGMKYSPRRKGLLQVWDLHKEAWRMVNVTTLQKINGIDVVIDVRDLKFIKVPTQPADMQAV